MDQIKEGKLYKSITVGDVTFDIYYGYYSEAERELWEPAPIYPDFIKNPLFTQKGNPYARADQNVCEHYSEKPETSGENWCNDCTHFTLGNEIIGICLCDTRRKDISQ